jgi:hypothetical protein
MRRKEAKKRKEDTELRKKEYRHSECTREESTQLRTTALTDGFFTSTFRMTGSKLYFFSAPLRLCVLSLYSYRCPSVPHQWPNLFFALLRVFAAHLKGHENPLPLPSPLI